MCLSEYVYVHIYTASIVQYYAFTLKSTTFKGGIEYKIARLQRPWLALRYIMLYIG